MEGYMKHIEISDAAHEKLAFAAKVAGIAISEAVDRLAGVSAETPGRRDSDTAPKAPLDDEIAVSVVYREQKVSGFLNLDSERLRITEAPVPDLIRTYGSPSQAAMEIVRALNPGRQRPETNGWRFFYAEDGQIIDRHRRRRS